MSYVTPGRGLDIKNQAKGGHPSFLLCLLCFIFFLIATVMSSGCASNRIPDVLDLGTGPGINADGQREIKDVTWPSISSGERPRYAYAGELYGEENFRPVKDADKNIGQYLVDALSWLVGLTGGNPVPVTLKRPQSGVVDLIGQRILVTDIGHKAVYVFDQKEGRLDVWENATPLKHFVGPTGIALGVSGEIFVADAELGYVTRLDRKGTSLGVIGNGILNRPIGLAFNALTQELFVADVHAHDIKVFGSEGQLLRTMGKRGEGPGEYNFPTYLALVKDELYVVDTMNARVQVINAVTGQSKRTIGERGLNVGNLVRPKGVAVDTYGNVYVIESYHDYLLVYNHNGDFLLPIGGTGGGVGQFYLPTGIWTDANNRIFVADMFNGRVAVFQLLAGE